MKAVFQLVVVDQMLAQRLVLASIVVISEAERILRVPGVCRMVVEFILGPGMELESAPGRQEQVGQAR